ncbi:MAG: serine/threonine protein kinase [Gammaproteobacteria bacterium]|nr:serine/threonine protein kinase [Gammaproteobacteria bacterium]
MQAQPKHFYEDLIPDTILNAVESLGLYTDGTLLALNSYENRVYQVGIEEDAPIIVKFYREGRWDDDTILEEHAFTLELAEHEIPVVPPVVDNNGISLHRYEQFRFALYPRRGGHWPDLDGSENRKWLGRFLGRIHGLGASKPFKHRPKLTIEHLGVESCQYLLENGFIPIDLEEAYSTLTRDLLEQIKTIFGRAVNIRTIRLHGDVHPGNILWTDQGPHFVDFDDACTGPAIQDLWMLLSGDRNEMSVQISDILAGYTCFNEFDSSELNLIEALRTLRLLHYSAWLARRWDDSAFPHNFPWFNTHRYWEEQILSLREQAALLNEPPLVWK